MFFRADAAASLKPPSGLGLIVDYFSKLIIWTAAYFESMPPVVILEFWIIFNIAMAY
jgi:hypothetical protein